MSLSRSLSAATSRIGFIGLGNLGSPMALALLRAGWAVAVHDRDPEAAAACKQEGAAVAAGPGGFADCAAVALAVPDDAAVEAVCEGPAGLFAVCAPGTAVVVHSTVLPATAERLAAAAAEHGHVLIDAPVSGGAERALQGTLTAMVGGGREGVAAVRPLLDAVAAEVLHVGPPGAGAAVKLANQLMMFSALAGVHEALDLAGAYGVAGTDVLAAVRTGTGDSWTARNWGFFDRVARAYDSGGTPVAERPWSKDLWEITAAARAAGVQVPVAGLLAQTLAERVESHAREMPPS
ncbi:2-hydroxy-3-oxopropionate reductase [Streptomonospora sediminis]